MHANIHCCAHTALSELIYIYIPESLMEFLPLQSVEGGQCPYAETAPVLKQLFFKASKIRRIFQLQIAYRYFFLFLSNGWDNS